MATSVISNIAKIAMLGTMNMPHPLIEKLRNAIGADHVLLDDAAASYAIDWRKRYFGKPLAVTRPRTTEEVAAIVKSCAEHRAPVVPQGGNTGLCGGATADDSGTAVVINLSRMNQVRSIDIANQTITVEAGCVLANLQSAAQEAGMLFPLSLASEGTAQIGGNLSTNAGGTAVLRYGNTRDLTLGLEVVLADGTVWDGLRGLRKDNTGYDMKQMFIGAEGTLGIITAAVMKLYAWPRTRITAIAALNDAHAVLTLFDQAQQHLGLTLTGFEQYSQLCVDLVIKHFPGSVAPTSERHPYYVLIEVSDPAIDSDCGTRLEALLQSALESGTVVDAVVAQNETQVRSMWTLRDVISEAQSRDGPVIKHDVSVPISAIAEFTTVTDEKIARAFPGVRMVTFGHVGDGNLHYNVAPAEGADPQAFAQLGTAISRLVHDSTAAFNGSISAEHGLGQYKRGDILRYKSAAEMALMHAVKHALDPLGIMNPGKVL